MTKKIYFGTNLKMYKNIQDTTAYLTELAALTADLSPADIQLFVIPSYTSLPAASQSINQECLLLGAQNMCWEEQGQFTGEISPLMLNELQLGLVMIGHSERRHVFLETNADENKKVRTALDHRFTTLLCIGETEEEKYYGISDEVLRTQLKVGFHNVSPDQASHLWVAYEPVWSIGINGTPASAEYADEKHQVIHQTLREIFGEAGDSIPVLYGGSVNHGNANGFIRLASVDGLFVGRSAWNAKDFNTLIRNAIIARNA